MKLHVKVNGIDFDVEVEHVDDGRNPVRQAPTAAAPVSAPAVSAAPVAAAPQAAKATSADGLISPVAGTVQEIKCRAGDKVKPGDTLLVVEAMKMQTNVPSDREGTVAKVEVAVGASVREGQLLVSFS